MDKTLQDRFGGLFFLVLGIFLWIKIPNYVPYEDELTKMGPRFFPQLASIGLIVLSIVLMISTFIKDDKRASVVVKLVLGEEKKVVAIFTITIIYAAIMEKVGYLISTSVIAVIIMLLLKVKKWYLYLITFAFIGVVYFIFHNIMYVPLP